MARSELMVHIHYLRKKIDEMSETLDKLEDKYVTKETFSPIQKIVYGLVAITGTFIVSALLKKTF